MVTDESTTGTADEAAAARDSDTALRSEQIRSKVRWLNTKREPVEISVADTRINGPVPRSRSPKVAPLKRISSYNWAASSERPQAVELSFPQLTGLKVRAMISPCTFRLRKRCSYSAKSLSP